MRCEIFYIYRIVFHLMLVILVYIVTKYVQDILSLNLIQLFQNKKEENDI